MMTLQTYLKEEATQLEQELLQHLQQYHTSERLQTAMQYSLLAGGKRIRPILMQACYQACGGRQSILAARLSIESMHTYSLIHDDLPCMDDDALRRGKPSCHIQFDEATAVLAGDALQALSFELLCQQDCDSQLKCRLLQKLAIAAGANGMVGGQMLDMCAENTVHQELIDIERIHLHKTGALLHYSCETGALLAQANDAQQQACSRYGKAIGLLFQIADDLLDATSNSQQLGKSVGKDAAQHKATYVSLLGIKQAHKLSEEIHHIAIQSLQPLGEQAQQLRQLAHYIIERTT